MTEGNLGDAVAAVLRREYARAQDLVRSDQWSSHIAALPEPVQADLVRLGEIRHNGRGVLLTLAACKAARPEQDIRAHKAEHFGGFNARGIDTMSAVPLLREWGLRNAGESHWLTQVFSGDAYTSAQVLRTQPKIVGEIVPRLVSTINAESARTASDAVCALLIFLILERNKGQLPLTKPKRLTIDRAIGLLQRHFNGEFKSGGPRLPQLAIYSAYECLIKECKRYEGHELVPIERLKTANRKSGTIGDVDVLHNGRAVEAVEIKFAMSVTARHVSDAIEKIKAADVGRYYILATDGVNREEVAAISGLVSGFYASNGCEIIVNGIYDSIRYYLRLIGSVDEFVAQYVDHLANDDDVSYEHRIAWNAACEVGSA